MNTIRPHPVQDILVDLADDSPDPQAFYRFAYSFSKCELDTTGIENFLGGDRIGAVEVDCVRTQLRKDLEKYATCPCTMYSFTLGILMLFDLSFFTVLGFTARIAWILIFSIVVGGTFFILICLGFWRQIHGYKKTREKQLKECLKTCNRFYLARRGAGIYIQKGFEGKERQIIVLIIFNIPSHFPGNIHELQSEIAQEYDLRQSGLVQIQSRGATHMQHIPVPPPLIEIDIERSLPPISTRNKQKQTSDTASNKLEVGDAPNQHQLVSPVS